ncbi:MAG: DUF4760 domain-containing protein [Succinivibrio sp.]|nr:DUF4760 domain-containing protein [Succinivibrio sp.]
MDIIQTVIYALSALIAAGAIIDHRILTKKTATLSVILADTKDEKFFNATCLIHNAIKNNRDLYEILHVDCKEHTEEAKALRLVLNRYEFYATGINQGILNEKLLKRLYFSNFTRFWKQAKPCVERIRIKQQRDTLFQEFEKVMNRWEKSPLKSEK